jgi:hypothetical protein
MVREHPVGGKRPLKPAAKPMTSTSTSSGTSDNGDLVFSIEHKKSEGMWSGYQEAMSLC